MELEMRVMTTIFGHLFCRKTAKSSVLVIINLKHESVRTALSLIIQEQNISYVLDHLMKVIQ